MQQVRICALGGFNIEIGGVSTPSFSIQKGAILLTYLSLHAGIPQPREKIAALLWENSSSAHGRASLRQTLSAIRRALPEAPCLVAAHHDRLTLTAENLSTDIADFENAMASDDEETLKRGLALYRGDLLEDVHVESRSLEAWLFGERFRLQASAVGAMLRLLDRSATSGAIEPSIALALKLLVIDPTQESVHRALINLYAAYGRPNDALRQYERCRADLARDLGVEPDPETTSLYHRIRENRRLPLQKLRPAGRA